MKPATRPLSNARRRSTLNRLITERTAARHQLSRTADRAGICIDAGKILGVLVKAELLHILLESLVRAGCALHAADGTDRIRLTPKGLRVARREEPEFTIRWPSEKTAVRTPAARTVPAQPPRTPRNDFAADLSPAARRRAFALRAWRKETAEDLGVAAFRIMGNKTLFRVAEENPRTLAHLSHIVYNQTLNEFGEDILDVLADA